MILKSDLIPHPDFSAKLREMDALRENLSVLIEEHESVLYGERDVLMAKYNRDVGYLEHELFFLEVEIAELRRRITILQADINRGRTVTVERVARLDEEIRLEFEKFWAEIEERESELRRSVDLLGSEHLMKPEDVRELKTLYRRICQRYHPDVGGCEVEHWEQIWSTLQHAYRAGDLDLLKALAETLDLSGTPPPETSDDLDTEIERLRCRIEKQSERLAKILSDPPFCYREKLEDPQWIRTKQEELKQKIFDFKEHRTELQRRYGILLPLSDSVH